jgi:hypothetical protein
MRINRSWIAAPLLAALLPLQAQDRTAPPAGAVYKVEFNIGDGKDAASRSDRRYTMLIDESGRGVFRVGNRVPVASGSFQPGVGGAGVSPLVNTQYTYLDVGVNIECRVRDVGNRIGLRGSVDLSTVVQPTPREASVQPNPTVGQTKVEIEATLELGKPTVVASVDDPVNMRQLAIQATVTRVN